MSSNLLHILLIGLVHEIKCTSDLTINIVLFLSFCIICTVVEANEALVMLEADEVLAFNFEVHFNLEGNEVSFSSLGSVLELVFHCISHNTCIIFFRDKLCVCLSALYENNVTLINFFYFSTMNLYNGTIISVNDSCEMANTMSRCEC